MASAVDHAAALAFGFLDGLCFALAFAVLTVLTLSFLPLTERVLLLVVGVAAAVGLPLAGYSTYRFHRDGQAATWRSGSEVVFRVADSMQS